MRVRRSFATSWLPSAPDRRSCFYVFASVLLGLVKQFAFRNWPSGDALDRLADHDFRNILMMMPEDAERLFEELNRQMIRIERTSQQVSDKKDASGNFEDNPEEREQHARTLTRIQTQLERLTRMEMQRASLRVTRKKSRKPSEIRAEIQRAILGSLGSGAARKGDGGTQ